MQQNFTKLQYSIFKRVLSVRFYEILFAELMLHQLAFLSLLIKTELNSTIFKFEFFIKLYILFP